jgi:hypothetical protein
MPEQQFPIGRRIHIPGHFAEPVVLESVRALGEGFECRIRLPDGTPDEAILSRDEAASILGQQTEAPTSIRPADAESIRLLVESTRIRLAYTHDRHFAVSLAGIRTLPHQIEAVYLRMLPQPRLRFLLADGVCIPRPADLPSRGWSTMTITTTTVGYSTRRSCPPSCPPSHRR